MAVWSTCNSECSTVTLVEDEWERVSMGHGALGYIIESMLQG